ncbi:uncharacterized protein LOC144869373 [Branchiostoma floridae x Branchiostoma japonicum]
MEETLDVITGGPLMQFMVLPITIVIEGIPDPPFYPNFGIDDLTLTSVQNDVGTGCTCANTCPPVGSEFPPMATSSPDEDPVIASSRSSSGVDPAVCAGIAITTAAVGVVVGVLATLLVHRLRNGTEASKVYEDVNSTAGPLQAPSNPLYEIPMDCLPARQNSEREAATKPLPMSTLSKNGQLGQQSGRTGQADITALSCPVPCLPHSMPIQARNGAQPDCPDNGMYVCFFLEMLPVLGTNRARLISPTINTAQQVVMSLAIGTVRPPTGPYLNVILVNQTGTETLLCSTSDLLLPWQRLYVGVVQPGPYQIVIEGIPDPPFYPNFGIDDLKLTAVQNATANVDVQSTKCSTELLTTVPMTTWQYNTTLPMTSGQADTTTPMALSQDTTSVHGQHNTTLPMTSGQVHTTTPTAGGQDTTAFPQTSGQQVTTLPMATSNNTHTVPTTSIQGTSTFLSTATTDVATGCTCANTCPPVGSEFPPMATNSPHGDPVVASSRSSSGVDPAVCAGIAITTAAVGVVVGVLATLLVHRLRNGTDSGQYICFFLEGLQGLGINKARFISPTINTTRHVVLSFAIGTVRPPDAIYMNIIMADEHGGGEELLCSTSDLLLPWQRIQVGIGMSGPYKVVIEGVPNPPFYPNFGIDDVTLTVAEPGTTTVGAPTAKCSLQVTTPSMSTVTEAVQGGTPGQSDIILVPIVLGSAGGLLIVGLGAFLLWRKYVRKVSPAHGE